ncbi:hypothetical protein DFH06DRAFT_1463804 [Mycena polygramma]|nr:hypothetical protein DFH06DRAFT_1463804 [Mycena polygramma]
MSIEAPNPTKIASRSAPAQPEAHKLRFPPFPKVPEGVTIVAFKNFTERGIQVFRTEDGIETDGLDEARNCKRRIMKVFYSERNVVSAALPALLREAPAAHALEVIDTARRVLSVTAELPNWLPNINVAGAEDDILPLVALAAYPADILTPTPDTADSRDTIDSSFTPPPVDPNAADAWEQNTAASARALRLAPCAPQARRPSRAHGWYRRVVRASCREHRLPAHIGIRNRAQAARLTTKQACAWDAPAPHAPRPPSPSLTHTPGMLERCVRRFMSIIPARLAPYSPLLALLTLLGPITLPFAHKGPALVEGNTQACDPDAKALCTPRSSHLAPRPPSLSLTRTHGILERCMGHTPRSSSSLTRHLLTHAYAPAAHDYRPARIRIRIRVSLGSRGGVRRARRMKTPSNGSARFFRVFLSSCMKCQGFFSDERKVVSALHLLRFFVDPSLRNHALPDSTTERRLRFALEIISAAGRELPDSLAGLDLDYADNAVAAFGFTLQEACVVVIKQNEDILGVVLGVGLRIDALDVPTAPTGVADKTR